MTHLVEGGIMSRRKHLDSSLDEQRSNHCDGLNFFEFRETLDFQTEKMIADDYYAACSLPFWMCRSPTDSEYEVSHLLSQSKHTSSSPSSRFQGIEDGSKVLMELIENMPESSYELSLRDIIDDHQSYQEKARKEMIMEGNLIGKPRVILPTKTNNTSRRVQSLPSRSNSNSSKVFMIRMFIPIPLGFKTKLEKRSCSTILPRPSFDGSDKQITKDRSEIKMTISDRRNNKKCKTINKSANGNESRKSRENETNFQSCWPFLRKNSNQGD